MPGTPPENSHSPRLRQPSRRHRRSTPRLPDDGTQRKVQAVIKQPSNDRLNEGELHLVADALGGMQFRGQNPSFEDYDRQTPRERGDATSIVEQENSDWINTALEAVPDARWIKVENGCVVDGGGRDFMPDNINVYEEGKRKGIVPFVFYRPEAESIGL